MASKIQYKTTFEADQVIQPIYTGGSVALDNSSRILATTLGEDAVLTDLVTGKLFAKIEGDGEPVSTLILTPSASHLIVCSRSLTMRIYALQTSADYETVGPTLLRTLKPHATPAVVLAVDRTSSLLATGAADGNIKVWDIRGGFVTHTFRGPSVLVSALYFFEVAESAASSAKEKKDKKKKAGKQEKSQIAIASELGASMSGQEDLATRFRLAAGSQDGKVRVWDLHRRTVVANLEAHASDVQVLAYSAAQQTFLTASRDKTMTWWDAQTWTSRRVVPTFDLVEAGGFLEANGDASAGASASSSAAEGEAGALVFTAGANGCVRLWETRTGREVTTEQAARSDEEAIVAALYRPQQQSLLCVQLDQTLALYPVQVKAIWKQIQAKKEVAPLEPLRRISGTHDDIIDLAFLLPDQSLMALATNSEDVRIVSVGEDSTAKSSASSYFGQDVALLKGHSDMVISLDVDWSGHWIATGSKDNSARLWRVSNGSSTSSSSSPSDSSFSCYAIFSGHAESVGAVALSKTVPPADSVEFQNPLAHPPAFLVTGSQDLTIKRWEVPRQASAAGTTQQAVFTRKAHDKDINALDVDVSSQLFASASQDRVVKIWSVREGEVQGTLRGHRRGVWSVRFAPPDTATVTGEDGASVAGSNGSSSSRQRSRLILTGSGDKTVKIWSMIDYTCLRTFEGHTNSVLKVVWLGSTVQSTVSDDDTDRMEDDDDADAVANRAGPPSSSKAPVLFASAGGDGLVKVWDASAGEAVCTLDNHEDRVWALAVQGGSSSRPRKAAGRGRTLVSGGGDATVTFWRDTTVATAAAAADEARERVEQEQELANHMRHGAFREAVMLALQLNQPGRLLAVLSEALSPGSATTKQPNQQTEKVEAVLASLDDDQLFTLLLRVRDWNTNGRTAAVAQRVLATLVHAYSADKLASLARSRVHVDSIHNNISSSNSSEDNTRFRNRNIQDVLDALLAYTERHYRRMAELLDESYLVDYTLREMDALQEPVALPAGDDDVAMAGV